MKGNRRDIQGHNAQAVVNEQQIVLAAEISTSAADFGQLCPMIEAALHGLERAGATEKPAVVVADAQYWHDRQMDNPIAEHGMQVLISPDSGKRRGERPGWTGRRYSFMRRALATDVAKEIYRKRQQSIEPVFGNAKHNRKIYRFNNRGRSLVRTEWRLAMLTHNLTELHRHQIATALAQDRSGRPFRARLEVHRDRTAPLPPPVLSDSHRGRRDSAGLPCVAAGAPAISRSTLCGPAPRA